MHYNINNIKKNVKYIYDMLHVYSQKKCFRNCPIQLYLKFFVFSVMMQSFLMQCHMKNVSTLILRKYFFCKRITHYTILFVQLNIFVVSMLLILDGNSDTVRTYGVNQVFLFVKNIWLHRQTGQIRFFFGKDLFSFMRAQHVLSYNLI